MNGIIKFLDHNGMRPIIALVVIVGTLVITLKSKEICLVQIEYPQASSTSSGTQLQIYRENPICSRYFEIAALVLGGFLGLAKPGKSESEDELARKQQTTPEKNKSEKDD